MTGGNWRLKIRSRRSELVAAAIAGAGAVAMGCDKDAQVSETNHAEAAGLSSRPSVSAQPRLRPMIGPIASSKFALDRDYPFEVEKGDKTVAFGTVKVKTEGGTVPFAADVAAGQHMRNRTRTCFLESADRGETMAGEIDIVLDVASDGRVTKAVASTESKGGEMSSTLRDCLLERIQKLGFNPIKDGKSARVIIQLSMGTMGKK